MTQNSPKNLSSFKKKFFREGAQKISGYAPGHPSATETQNFKQTIIPETL
jgi:hypothetical protein